MNGYGTSDWPALPPRHIYPPLELQPITLKAARAYVDTYHRHHKAPQGGKFAIALNSGDELIGVIIVGRPISRRLDDGWTAEVTRCCTDGTANAPSMLYSAAWRASRAMGYKRLITYVLQSETGNSLLAANWKCIGKAGGRSWNNAKRPRVDKHPLGSKTLWEAA